MPASLAGVFSVDESAALLRHYRYVVERMMRALAGWIALTPELPAKLVMGHHVWDNAQHCDAFGRRLLELRSAAQTSEPASAPVVALMDAVERPEEPQHTVERLVGIYRVVKPHLLDTYAWHRERANPVYEPPTRRILDRCIEDERRHIAAGEIVLRHLARTGGLREQAARWHAELTELLVAAAGIGGRGLPPPHRDVVGGSAEGEEFVRLGSESASLMPPASLGEVIGRLGDALVARDGGLAVLSGAGGTDWQLALDEIGAERHRLVALARVGGHFLAKLALDGRRGSAIMITRWAPTGDGWHLAAAEVLNSTGRLAARVPPAARPPLGSGGELAPIT